MNEFDLIALKRSIDDLKLMQKNIETGIEDNREAVKVVSQEVKTLHYQVNGNPSVTLPSGDRDRGLTGKVWDYGETIEVVKDMIRVLKIVGGIFLAALGTTVALLLDRLL
jgi:hypothetical protein